jgi:hypothetical protein
VPGTVFHFHVFFTKKVYFSCYFIRNKDILFIDSTKMRHFVSINARNCMNHRPMAGLFCLILFALSIPAFSQEPSGDRSPLSLSLGLEANGYSVEGMAFGPGLAGEYRFSPALAAGVSLGFFHDFTDYATFESAAFLRWYPVAKGVGPFSGLFAQGLAGAAFMWSGDDMKTFPMGGLELGLRLNLGKGDWYVEPRIRGGYPFNAGAGVAVGWRHKKREELGSRSEELEAGKQEAAWLQDEQRQEEAEAEIVQQAEGQR